MFHRLQKPAKSTFVVVALSSLATGCVTAGRTEFTSGAYGQVEPGAERFEIAAVDTSAIDPRFLRQAVDYRTAHPAGTVVVDPHKRFLYLVTGEGRAVRYGVGVGRAGLAFAGAANVQVKKEWPHWTPTQAMIAREPARYAKWAAGMKGGEGNPLGARALYLFRGWQRHAVSNSRHQ